MKKRKTHEKHGMSRTKAYRAWADMISRCHNENSQEFFRYGARGISVCDEWRNSFARFLADVGLPKKGQSIDRVNPELGYNKDNCRWAGSRTQSINQRIPKTNTSGYKGIRKVESGGLTKWVVQISANNKTYHVGYFTNLDEAVKARLGAELRFHDDANTTEAIKKNKKFNKDYCPGVNWNSRKGEFQARIQRHKKSVHLGYFPALLDAVAARKSAEIEICYSSI